MSSPVCPGHLFDEIDEIGIRDGANITIDGYEFAPNFSIWTTIEECSKSAGDLGKAKGWFTTEPFRNMRHLNSLKDWSD